MLSGQLPVGKSRGDGRFAKSVCPFDESNSCFDAKYLLNIIPWVFPFPLVVAVR